MRNPIQHGQFGIEQLTDIQNVVIQGIKSGKIAAADDKFNLMDIPVILPFAKPLQEAVDGADQTDDEYFDLYDGEIDSLVERYDKKAADADLTPQQQAVGRRVLKVIYNCGALVREIRTGATV